MRTFLLVLIVVEGLALFAAGGLLLSGIEEQRAELPSAAVFRPPIYDATIGQSVRYRRERLTDGKLLGYLEYRVDWAEEYKGTTLGRAFRMIIVERDETGRETRRRKMLVRPRDVVHGFLPPLFDEDIHELVPGARPVIASIETADFRLRESHKKTQSGFLIETIRPRDSLSKIAERYWIHRKVPVFGVARWERGPEDEVFVLHTMERAGS